MGHIFSLGDGNEHTSSAVIFDTHIMWSSLQKSSIQCLRLFQHAVLDPHFLSRNTTCKEKGNRKTAERRILDYTLPADNNLRSMLNKKN